MKAKVLNKRLIVSLILCLLPIVIGLVLYDSIPEQMPIHWASSGAADGFIAKSIGVWLVPLFLLAIHLLVSIGTMAKSESQQMAKMTLLISYWAVPIVAVIVEPMALLKAAGYAIDIVRLVLTVVGILLVIAGNYMPKNQPNTTAGYRLPWTVGDVNNWKRTHLLAGKLWILVGLAMLFCGWTNIGDTWLLIVFMVVALVVPMFYSFAIRSRH